MAKSRKVVEIPPGEAVFIVEALILDGRLEPRTLEEYRGRYLQEIQSLEARIARLKDLASPLLPAAVGAVAVVVAQRAARGVRLAAPRVARRLKRTASRAASTVSPERARTRALQGKYLGLMRQIPRSVVKQRFGKDAIAKKGKEAVIAEMESYLSKRP